MLSYMVHCIIQQAIDSIMMANTDSLMMACVVCQNMFENR